MTQDRPQYPDGTTGRGATPGPAEPQSPAERLSRLEAQVVTLAEAVRALAHGLERLPARDTPSEEEAARGARLAHELLLSQGL